MRWIQFIEQKKLVVNNPCTKTTCQNGGTCYAENLINVKCFCQEDFDGRNCEIDKRPTTNTSTTTTTNTTTERFSKLKIKNTNFFSKFFFEYSEIRSFSLYILYN